MAKIVFCALHFTYFRNYDSAIRELVARGHEFHLTADEAESSGGLGLVQTLASEYPQAVTWGFAPSLDGWAWRPLALWVRRTLQYIRFIDPYYDSVPKYRERAKPRASRLVVGFSAIPGVNHPLMRRAAAALLSALERAIPAPPPLVEFFREHRADVVLLASVTNPGAPQLDHLKAAQAAGARTVMPVWSWDHLSGKAWIRIAPDRVLVWNDSQRDEARNLHGLPADRIVVTGAQCFDQWFGRAPSRTRDEFLRAHGLDPQRELLVYVCSVLRRPTPPEAPFTLAWIGEIRRCSDRRIREANILIRPHPERMEEWTGVSLSEYGPIAVVGRNPVDVSSRDEYFDSLHFSRAVVGLATSAFLEAAVAGRPVFTVMKPEYRIHQMGSPHFRYLIELAGGLLHTADDWPEHLQQLEAAFRDDGAERERLTRFLEAFVRPRGIAHAATPVFADAVEAVLAEPASVQAAPSAAWPARTAAIAMRELLDAPLTRQMLLGTQDLEDLRRHEQREQEERTVKIRLAESRRIAEAAQERERVERLRKKEAQRREKAGVVRERDDARTARRRAKERQKALAGIRARLRRALHVADR